ncbi:MAG: hypothetical protein LBS92_01610 [Candidatus Methanoplasma sp.]|nr:hypothetical protein [Candidatus Methanoplasma sp.]
MFLEDSVDREEAMGAMSSFANERQRLIGEHSDENSLPAYDAIGAVAEWIETGRARPNARRS